MKHGIEQSESKKVIQSVELEEKKKGNQNVSFPSIVPPLRVSLTRESKVRAKDAQLPRAEQEDE